ncbi:MAG: Uma2 family endonuclease, partial [Microscillaceae bacterium]|nr:Uma2 family endonuclease [Microscillaceae bacterium]
MEVSQDFSLIDELGLKNDLAVVAQSRGKIVYAHTLYYEVEDFDYEKYITETDEPVDNLFSEKQQRLCIDILQNDKINWTTRNFMTASNVGIYYDKDVQKPVVPDMFLSFDIQQPHNWFEKKHKAYFTWVMGKAPDLVLEIVSNKVGQEDTEKLKIYAKIGVKYYIIQDPYQYLSEEKLRVYVLNEEGEYQQQEEEDYYMPEVNLGIALWTGLYEDTEAEWMRWCNKSGHLLLTAKEAIAKEIAEKEKERAEKEKERARRK